MYNDILFGIVLIMAIIGFIIANSVVRREPCNIQFRLMRNLVGVIAVITAIKIGVDLSYTIMHIDLMTPFQKWETQHQLLETFIYAGSMTLIVFQAMLPGFEFNRK